MFSINSDVTLVITSCGRFNLLKKTLLSFLEKNTYPIREIIIIEDSVNDSLYDVIPEYIKENTTVIINEENLGQIKSIDKAYSLVQSEFIFHCEDDWEFCRGGFIEDSKSILEDDTIITVQLRDIHNDMLKHYDFHYLGERQITANSVDYYLLLSHSAFRGFTFNPSLKRKRDYSLIGSYYRPGMNSGQTECFLSNFYEVYGMRTAILKNFAVRHIGWQDHILLPDERLERKRMKKKKIKWSVVGFIFGLAVGLAFKFI